MMMLPGAGLVLMVWQVPVCVQWPAPRGDPTGWMHPSADSTCAEPKAILCASHIATPWRGHLNFTCRCPAGVQSGLHVAQQSAEHHSSSSSSHACPAPACAPAHAGGGDEQAQQCAGLGCRTGLSAVHWRMHRGPAQGKCPAWHLMYQQPSTQIEFSQNSWWQQQIWVLCSRKW